jgi:hypothetical protein
LFEKVELVIETVVELIYSAPPFALSSGDEILLPENVQPVIDTAPTPPNRTPPPSAPPTPPGTVELLFEIVQFVILRAPPYHMIPPPPEPYVAVLLDIVQFVKEIESNGEVRSVPPIIAPPP